MFKLTCRRKYKKELLFLHKFVKRRPKDVPKGMSLGHVYIMMFYGRSENVNLTHSLKPITITFLKNSFTVPPGSKSN